MNHEKRLARAKRVRKELRKASHHGDGQQHPAVSPGNVHSGCPYHGKDRYSGMWKKFKDRSYKMRKPTGEIVTVVMPYDNNKYEVHGGLKGV